MNFGQQSINYVGHIISGLGLLVDQHKIIDMVNWPKPSFLKQLRGFLGRTDYYQKFVKNYGLISKPLMDMLKKDAFH